MTILSVQQLHKYFGERCLFSDLTFSVGEQDRIGFIGENGCGKTTLFRILTGEETADGGAIVRAKELRIGYMEQHTCRIGERTLWDETESVFKTVTETEAALAQINARLADGETDTALLAQQQVLRERFERMGGLYYKSRVRATLLGLGFDEAAFSQPVSSLSGGQRSKAAMAKLLLSDVNLLLLDEPTNHLDIAAVEWLEEFLRGYNGAAIIISHDRYFLDRVTTRTLELAGGHLYASDCSYSVHREKREKEKETAEKHYETAMREIERIEKNITLLKQWNREKSIRTAESKQKAVDRLREGLDAPEREQAAVHFSFSAAEVGGNEVLTVGELAMGFGERQLFSDVGFQLRRGEKVFLLGPNGCGKTTLLKLLNGMLTPSSGYFRLGAKVTVGYYDQVQDSLDTRKTALEELADAYPQMTGTALRSAMAAFLFRGDQVFKPVSMLSGGEKARLLLLKLMLARHNLLLLDEPTNHLDIASREALEEALLGYSGTALIVSHDRYFINRLADRVLHLTPNGCEAVNGNYDTYTARLAAVPVSASLPQTAQPPRQNDYKQRKEAESAKRKLCTQISRAEEAIAALEEEAAALHKLLESEEIMADYAQLTEITEKLTAVTAQADEKMQLWSDLQEQLETFS